MIKRILGQQVHLLNPTEKDFNTRNKECSGEQPDYCGIVLKEYLTQFQVEITPTTGAELVTNGNFFSNIDDWNGTAGFATWSSQFGGSMFVQGSSGVLISQNIAVDTDSYYVIEADVLSDSINGVAQLYADGIIANNPSPETSMGAGILGKKLAFYFKSGTNTSIDLTLLILNNVYIRNVTMKKLTIPTVKVRDCDGNEKFDGVVELWGARGIVKIDWTQLVEDTGCFKICVFPSGDLGVNHLVSGDFLYPDSNENDFLTQNS